MKRVCNFSLLKDPLKFIVILSLVTLLFSIEACDKGPTPEEAFLKKISKNWKSSSIGVKLDGTDVNVAFDGFALTLTTGSTYTSSNGNPPIWAATGKFTLKPAASTGFSLMRDDGVVVTVQELTDIKLVLKFPYVSKGARVGSVSGAYVFDLIPTQ